MSLTQLASLAQAGFEVWLAAFAILVIWSLATNPERLSGLLTTRPDGGIEPERLQSLIIMLAAAVAYLTLGAKALGQSPIPHRLPDISQTWLTALTGSQILYLGGKIGRTLS